MTKYSTYSRRASEKPRPYRVHPIWRGIGCLFMIIIPVMSYAGATMIVHWDVHSKYVPIPKEFAMSINIPYIGRVPYFGANLIVTLVLAMVGFAVLMSIYALVYRLVGPQGSPLDAPPIRRKVRRSR